MPDLTEAPRSAAPGRGAFWSMGIGFRGILDVFIMLGLAASWLGLGGAQHWVLDLASHFRWQYVAVCLVGLGWAGWGRRRGVGAAAGLTLLLNVGLLVSAARGGAPEGKEAPGFRLRVVSLNVQTSNRQYGAVRQYLERADADVIFLLEVDRSWERALEPLRATHPHHLVRPRSDNFGLACYSRLPLESLRVVGVGDLELPDGAARALGMDSLEVRLTVAGHALILLGTHPVPPLGGSYAEARDGQLAALGRRVGQAECPVLLVGDLNASPWSQGMRRLRAQSGLQLGTGGWRPTWQVGSVFALPLDHALATPPLAIAERHIGPEVGSDHRGQLIELRWME